MNATKMLIALATLAAAAQLAAQDNAPTAEDSARTSGSVQPASPFAPSSHGTGGVDCIGDVLLYNNNATFDIADEALTDLGLAFTLATSGNFTSLMSGQTWDLIVLDLPSTLPSGAWQTGLINHVSAGGKLIFTAWDATSFTAPLQAALGVSAPVAQQTRTFQQWPAGSALWTGPNTLPTMYNNWADVWGTNGFRVEPVGGAIAVAGFVASPTANQAAIVSANGGNTYFNGFVFDDYNPMRQDMINLIENQIASFCPSGGGGGEVPASSTTGLVLLVLGVLGCSLVLFGRTAR